MRRGDGFTFRSAPTDAMSSAIELLQEIDNPAKPATQCRNTGLDPINRIAQRQQLRPAGFDRLGGDDEAVTAVALRWRSIYARIIERAPFALAGAGDRGKTTRGWEKRRPAIAFVTAHPEELRPYPQAPQKGSQQRPADDPGYRGEDSTLGDAPGGHRSDIAARDN
jgi:hypothetical protein